jgi:hypothetical protein
MTIVVGHRRAQTEIPFLDGGDVALLRRMRAHGNVIETVPMVLLAKGFAERNGLPQGRLGAGQRRRQRQRSTPLPRSPPVRLSIRRSQVRTQVGEPQESRGWRCMSRTPSSFQALRVRLVSKVRQNTVQALEATRSGPQDVSRTVAAIVHRTPHAERAVTAELGSWRQMRSARRHDLNVMLSLMLSLSIDSTMRQRGPS